MESNAKSLLHIRRFTYLVFFTLSSSIQPDIKKWKSYAMVRAPYTGREIKPQRYCSRLVLPVEE